MDEFNGGGNWLMSTSCLRYVLLRIERRIAGFVLVGLRNYGREHQKVGQSVYHYSSSDSYSQCFQDFSWDLSNRVKPMSTMSKLVWLIDEIAT